MRRVVPQTVSDDVYALSVHINRAENTGSVRLAHRKSEFVSPLPSHPAKGHPNGRGGGTFTLNEALTEHTTEVLSLPDCPDVDNVYVGEGVCEDGDGTEDVFLRAVWYTPHTADSISDRPLGTHENSVRNLHAQWRGLGDVVRKGGVAGCRRDIHGTRKWDISRDGSQKCVSGRTIYLCAVPPS